MEFKEISTQALIEQSKAGAKILDLRSPDAYNGWRLRNEKRGGHIKGAKSLPAKWANYMDWIEAVQQKNIQTEDTIILYGYSAEQTEKTAEKFQKSGYRKVFIYNDFISEWSADEKYPMEQLPNFKTLVPPQWIKSILDGEQPEHYHNNKFIILHAHYRNRNAYLSGHIPAAADIDTLELESSESWNRKSPEELRLALEKHGITADTTVVLYGKFMHPDNEADFPGSSAGQLGAIRCALIMMYAGVKDVRVLNGGFQSWKDAGYEVTSNDVHKISVSRFGAEIPQKPELIVDIQQAKQMIQSSDAELVCVRSYSEYIGEVSGYNYIEAKGRIPGAVFADCGSDAYHMENYRNLDHTLREYHETEEIWRKNGITPDKHLAFYCGTGWRGSEAWFNAWLMGRPRVSVFDGGWFEWSNDPENPRETGIPKE